PGASAQNERLILIQGMSDNPQNLGVEDATPQCQVGLRRFVMRFVHSSDLQIGKSFGRFEPEIAALLQDARQKVVRALGEAAVRTGASVVIIAGDFYEK